MASDFDFDLPLNQYFLSEVAEHLESKGINCLDDLIDAMYGEVLGDKVHVVSSPAVAEMTKIL